MVAIIILGALAFIGVMTVAYWIINFFLNIDYRRWAKEEQEKREQQNLSDQFEEIEWKDPQIGSRVDKEAAAIYRNYSIKIDRQELYEIYKSQEEKRKMSEKRPRDIDDPKYQARKEIDYDDDVVILFYNGHKVLKGTTDTFKSNMMEEMSYFSNAKEMLEKDFHAHLEGPVDKTINEQWDDIWDNLDWDAKSKSYKYGRWEMICLDI